MKNLPQRSLLRFLTRYIYYTFLQHTVLSTHNIIICSISIFAAGWYSSEQRLHPFFLLFLPPESFSTLYLYFSVDFTFINYIFIKLSSVNLSVLFPTRTLINPMSIQRHAKLKIRPSYQCSNFYKAILDIVPPTKQVIHKCLLDMNDLQ